MIWYILGLIGLGLFIKYCDEHFCAHCRKFSAKPAWSGPAFRGVMLPVPDEPEIVLEVRRLVKTCSCCGRTRALRTSMTESSKEKADAYYAGLKRPSAAAPES